MKQVVLTLLILLAADCAAAQSTALTNTMDEPIKLWLWKNKRWDRPPIYFARNERKIVDLKVPGKYYVVIRDDLKRELRVGQVDLHEFAGKEIALDVLYETRGKAEALALVQGVITYSWNPTSREQPAMVTFVPHVPGWSYLECDERFEINQVTGDAIKRRFNTICTPEVAP